MNNDLEQFSEERLIDMQKHVTAGMTLGHADAFLVRQAIDIALAAKQAKPVAFTGSGSLSAIKVGHEGYIWGASAEAHPIELYTTQPAHTEQVIPGGWKLVPIEPTKAMLDEFDSIIDFGAEDSCDAWRRLIASAPKPEGE